MKSKLIISILFIVTILISNVTNAASIDMELTPTEQEIEITNTNKEILFTIYLKDFVNIEENTALGYSAVLQYETALFSDVQVTGENGWNIEYNKTTGKIIADTSNAEANSKIGTIRMKVKTANLAATHITKVKLSDILLTDGNFELKFEKETEIEIKNKLSNSKNNETQQVTDFISSTPAQNTFNSLTSASTKRQLPNAGNSKFIVVIVLLIILMAFFKFKSRKIKY